MEFLFLGGFVVALSVFVSMFFIFTFFSDGKPKSMPKGAKLPPGKMGWPVLGESLDFLKNGKSGTPEKFFRERMAKFSNQVFTTSLFGDATAVFCGCTGNKLLFSNETKLVNVWWPRSVDKMFPSSLKNSTTNDESMKMRKFLPNFLKAEPLKKHIGTMDAIAKKHIESYWDNKKEVMVFPLSKTYTLSLACKLFLSIDDPTHFYRFAETFSELVSGIISIPIDLPGTLYNRGIKASKKLRDELVQIIKQRKTDLAANRASPNQDILSQMLLTADDDGIFMKEEDIASNILGVLVGGHDTASATLTFIVKYLAEYPHIYDQVLKEQLSVAEMKKPGELLNWDDLQKMKYSWNVACEALRLAPPTQGAFRQAIVDFDFAGYFIPKGRKLYWSTNSTHKNEEYFPEPEKFDPTRFEGKGPAPYTYVPFGGGPRMCPGKEYSRLEILVFMYHLVRKFNWEKVLPNENIIVDPLPRPAKGLPVMLHPRAM